VSATQKSDRLRTLLETGIAISSELSIDAVLQRIVEAAAGVTGARYAALGVIDRAGTGLERFVTTGVDDETQAAIGALPRGRGILGVLISDARTLRLHDLGSDPRSVGFPPNHPPMRSFLGTPIRLHDRVYGNLYLTEKEGGADFDEEDEELVTILAGQAAVAIENARLWKAERATHSRQERLQLVSDLALAHAELDDLLSALIPLIRHLLAADTCALLLLDEDSQKLVVRAGEGAGIDPQGVLGLTLPISGTVVGRVAAEGKPMVLADVTNVPGLHPILGELGIKSLCFVPLLMPGQVVGVLHVGTLSPRVFTEDEVELLRLAADRAAVAIVHARLFQAERETAEALARTNEELRQLDQMKDLFVSGVSHELRTPLTSMLGYLEVLLGGEVGELNDDQRHFVEIIDRNCHRLTDLINDILFMSRLDSGRFQLERGSIDLGEVVAERVESIRPMADRKHVEVHLEISDPSPQLWADASRLAQVVDNLLSNAVKFTPEDGDAFVTVASGETAHLEVRDTGVGIPTDEADRLFERFFRASTARNIPGTGLGLSITKTIVEAHGGTISFHSSVGVGTTFTIDLPVTEPAAVDTSAEEATT
jgi:signal transduction histidine kinase